MYRHILVAVDGSPSSRAVTTHAYELAAQLGASCTVLHVLDDVTVPFVNYGMEPYVNVEAINPELIEAQRTGAERMVADLARGAPGDVEVSGAVVEAGGRRIGQSITDEAEARGADLVVVGTHGHRGLSRVFVGSVADAVVRSADVPVTVVRVRDEDDEAGEA
ncbi:MAG: universal stress protein [Actinobacteria bacterium]|nr:universal stress protein [Actinomycetota bacterium]